MAEIKMEHKITALTLQKRNRQRVNVYLDGEFAFGLARILTAWMQVGQTLSDEKIAQLKAEDEHEVAYQRAIKFLNYRPRTENEIRQNLRKHDVPDNVRDEVVQRLQRAGLLDDRRFARAWVETRVDLHPRSRRALAYELKQRGVGQQVIEQSLEEVDDDHNAYRAALKQSRKLRKLDWQGFRQKLYGYLARRGFNYETSAPVVQRVWQEIHDSPNPMNEEV
ncbi:MAG: RecX family transcriptional regulator [Anaerolineales bacterium]